MIIMIGAPGPAAVPARPGAFRPAGVRAESAAGLTQESLPRWRYCIMIGTPAAVPGRRPGRQGSESAAAGGLTQARLSLSLSDGQARLRRSA